MKSPANPARKEVLTGRRTVKRRLKAMAKATST
jgi:hypothetical protein